jgi:hypothetical protein
MSRYRQHCNGVGLHYSRFRAMQSRRPLAHQALSTRRFSKSESNPRTRAKRRHQRRNVRSLIPRSSAASNLLKSALLASAENIPEFQHSHTVQNLCPPHRIPPWGKDHHEPDRSCATYTPEPLQLTSKGGLPYKPRDSWRQSAQFRRMAQGPGAARCLVHRHLRPAENDR